MKTLQHVKGVLMHVLENYNLSGHLQEQQGLLKWSEAVGPLVAQHATPVRVWKGRLIVKVDHPTWSHELTLLKRELLKKLHEAAGNTSIKDIRFTL